MFASILYNVQSLRRDAEGRIHVNLAALWDGFEFDIPKDGEHEVVDNYLSKPHPPCNWDNTGRSTAAIDRAWRDNDAKGVEQALRNYAREDEQVVCLTIENSRHHPTEFYLEMWAENITLAPKAKLQVFICERKQLGPEYSYGHRTYVDISEESIVLYAPTGAMAYILAETAKTPDVNRNDK